MASALFRLGAGAVRHRMAVLLVWIAVLVGGVVGAVTLAGETSNTFSIPGQESTTALRILGEEFGEDANGAGAQVVLEAPAGTRITDPANATAVAGVVAGLAALDGVVTATDPFDQNAPTISPDLAAAYSTVTYDVQAPEITDEQRDEWQERFKGVRD